MRNRIQKPARKPGGAQKRTIPAADISVLAAALRALNELKTGRIPTASDVDLVRSSALFEERDLDFNELAFNVASRHSRLQ
jgi:hypothetical protein